VPKRLGANPIAASRRSARAVSGRNVRSREPIQFSIDKKFIATLATLAEVIASQGQARDEL